MSFNEGLLLIRLILEPSNFKYLSLFFMKLLSVLIANTNQISKYSNLIENRKSILKFEEK